MSVILSDVKRVCHACGSDKTYVDKKGKIHWYGNGDTGLWLCEKCENKYIKNPKWHPINNPLTNPKTNAKWDPINGPKDILFRGRPIRLPFCPRIGVCNWCRAVVGEIDAQTGKLCKRTALHHDRNRYDDEQPLKFTIEICSRCHGIETRNLE